MIGDFIEKIWTSVQQRKRRMAQGQATASDRLLVPAIVAGAVVLVTLWRR